MFKLFPYSTNFNDRKRIQTALVKREFAVLSADDWDAVIMSLVYDMPEHTPEFDKAQIEQAIDHPEICGIYVDQALKYQDRDADRALWTFKYLGNLLPYDVRPTFCDGLTKLLDRSYKYHKEVKNPVAWYVFETVIDMAGLLSGCVNSNFSKKVLDDSDLPSYMKETVRPSKLIVSFTFGEDYSFKYQHGGCCSISRLAGTVECGKLHFPGDKIKELKLEMGSWGYKLSLVRKDKEEDLPLGSVSYMVSAQDWVNQVNHIWA